MSQEINTVNKELVQRFKDVYRRLYGINPEVVWVGDFYRSPHLPTSMNPRMFRSHIIRLEHRTADPFDED